MSKPLVLWDLANLPVSKLHDHPDFRPEMYEVAVQLLMLPVDKLNQMKEVLNELDR